MLFGLSDGMRITAERGREAVCPTCRDSLLAKCGHIRVWHWAHRSGFDCDIWSEPETKWHAGWKARFPTDWCEVPIGKHRADVQLPSGWVIELQHSPIQVEELREREAFYGRMVWLVDGTGLGDRLELRDRRNHVTFRWRWPRVAWMYARRRVYLDLGGPHLLRLIELYQKPGAGWGRLVPVEHFLRRALATAVYTEAA